MGGEREIDGGNDRAETTSIMHDGFFLCVSSVY